MRLPPPTVTLAAPGAQVLPGTVRETLDEPNPRVRIGYAPHRWCPSPADPSTCGGPKTTHTVSHAIAMAPETAMAAAVGNPPAGPSKVRL